MASIGQPRTRNSRSASPPRKLKPDPPSTPALSSGPTKDHHPHTLPLSPASQRDYTPGLWPTSATALRGRTMKEYDQQIADLEKENFHLKLRIYFLEEKMDHSFPDDTANLHKLNVQLEVELGMLKKELDQKHRLLEEALATLEKLEQTHKQELAALRTKSQKERCLLEKKLEDLQRETRSRRHSWSSKDDFTESARDEHLSTVARLESEVASLQQRLASKDQALVESIDVAVHTALLRATLAARDGDKEGIAAARSQLKSTLAKTLLDGEPPEEKSLQDFKDQLLEDFICLKEELKRKDEALQVIQAEQASREAELKELREELKSRRNAEECSSPKVNETSNQDVAKLFEQIHQQDSLIEDLQAKLLEITRSKETPIASLNGVINGESNASPEGLGALWSGLDSDKARLSEISGTAKELSHKLAKSVQNTLKADVSNFKLQDCVERLDSLMECLSKRAHPREAEPPPRQGFKLTRSKTLLNNAASSSVDRSLDSLNASQYTIDSLNTRNEESRPFEWPLTEPNRDEDTELSSDSKPQESISQNNELLPMENGIIEPNQRQMEQLKNLLIKARSEVHELQTQLVNRRKPDDAASSGNGSTDQWKRRSLSEFGNTHNVSELKEEIALLVLRLRQMSSEAHKLGSAGNMACRLATSQAVVDQLHSHLEELATFLSNLLNIKAQSSSSSHSIIESGKEGKKEDESLPSISRPWRSNSQSFKPPLPSSGLPPNSSDTDNLVLLLQPDPVCYYNRSVRPAPLQNEKEGSLRPRRVNETTPSPATAAHTVPPRNHQQTCWSSDSDIWSEPDRNVSLQRLGVNDSRLYSDEPFFKPRTTLADTNTDASNNRRPAAHKGPRTSKWRHKCETYLHSLVTLTRGLTIDLSQHRDLTRHIISKVPSHPKDIAGIFRKHGKAMEDLEERLEEVIYNNKRVQDLLKQKLYAESESPEDTRNRDGKTPPEAVTTKYGQLLDKLYSCREDLTSKSEKLAALEKNLAEQKSLRAQAETELAMTKKRVENLETQLEMKNDEIELLKQPKEQPHKAKEACNCWQWSIQRRLKGHAGEVEEIKKKIERKESQGKLKEQCKLGDSNNNNRPNMKAVNDPHFLNEMKQKEEWWKKKVEESEKRVETMKLGQERQMRANEHTISRLHFDLSARDCEIAQLQKRVTQLKEELIKNITSVSQLEVDKAELEAELNVAKTKNAEMEERCIWLQKELLAANTEKMESKETIEQLKDSIKENAQLTANLEQNLNQEHIYNMKEVQRLTVERDQFKLEVDKLSKELEQVSSLQDASSLRSSSDICTISRSWTKSSLDNLKNNEDYSKKLLMALTAEMRFLQNELGHRSHVNRRLRNKLRRYEEARQGGMSTSDGSLSLSDSASSIRTSNSFAFCKDLPPSGLRLTLKNSTEDSDLWSMQTTSQGGSPGSNTTRRRGQFSPDLGIESDAAAHGLDDSQRTDWSGAVAPLTSTPKSKHFPLDAEDTGNLIPQQHQAGGNRTQGSKVIGWIEDYDLLKRLVDESLDQITVTSAKVKELIFSTGGSSFVLNKKQQSNTLMDLDHSCQNIRVWLEKGRDLIGCFWITSSEEYCKEVVESSGIFKELSTLKDQLESEKKKNIELSNYLKVTKKEKGEMEQAISWHLTKTCKMLTEAKENLLREKIVEE